MNTGGWRPQNDFGNRADAGKVRPMQNEIDVVRDISGKFARAGISYMLTGSMALNYYAQPRMTRDIDVVVALESKDVETVLGLFGAEYYVAREAIVTSIEHESLFNLIHQETVIKVDCIVRKKTEYRILEFERRKRIQIRDFTTFIVSKEDLVISKLYWARDSHSAMQFRDIKTLLATGCDTTYIEDWTRKLDLRDVWQACLHE
jgi:hypothetical protein